MNTRALRLEVGFLARELAESAVQVVRDCNNDEYDLCGCCSADGAIVQDVADQPVPAMRDGWLACIGP